MEMNLLKSMLGELETAAKDLQSSLLARDTKGIWINLSKQDQSLNLLERFHRDFAIELEEETLWDPELRQLLERSRTVVQANRALTQRFLDVIDKTLSHLGGDMSPTYAARGTSPIRRTPMLVRQQG